MAQNHILELIDAEIERLSQARTLLTEFTGSDTLIGNRERSRNDIASKLQRKRNLTPEGRARIAEAVKRRWAAQRARNKG